MTTPNPATTDWVPLWPLGSTPVSVISSIPGEIKMWSGQTLPNQTKYGKWVWADGAIYAAATYPEAAANIDPAWKTAHGLSDPGAGNFRAPDLRGVVPAGLDAMPGGSRVNRITRSVAITICGRGGEEYHTITVAEMPAHAHGVTDPQHFHGPGAGTLFLLYNQGSSQGADGTNLLTTNRTALASTGISIQNNGGGGAHENLPPTIFVPWIVRLDG